LLVIASRDFTAAKFVPHIRLDAVRYNHRRSDANQFAVSIVFSEHDCP
jgi:hypothetical protein